jgi:hydroxylamine reductase
LNGSGCTKNGVCGKKGEVADLQDDLIYVLKSIAFYNSKARAHNLNEPETDAFMIDGLFATVTNTNFSKSDFEKLINEGFEIKDGIKKKLVSEKVLDERSGSSFPRWIKEKLLGTSPNAGQELPFMAKVTPESLANVNTGILATENEDIRSLRELLTYGLKGMAAYAHHANVLGYRRLSWPRWMTAWVSMNSFPLYLSAAQRVSQHLPCLIRPIRLPTGTRSLQQSTLV